MTVIPTKRLDRLCRSKGAWRDLLFWRLFIKTQNSDGFGDPSFLKKPDSSDSSCSCLNAGTSILQVDSAKRQHGDFLLTNLMQSRKASGRIVAFPEHWSKDGEIRPFGGSPGNVCYRVARDSDYGRIIPPCAPDLTDVTGRNVIRPQVYAIRAASNRNIHS